MAGVSPTLVMDCFKVAGLQVIHVRSSGYYSVVVEDPAALVRLPSMLYSAFCNQWVVLACCMLFGDLRKPSEWMR